MGVIGNRDVLSVGVVETRDGGRKREITTVGGNEANRSPTSGRLLISGAANRFRLHKSEGVVVGMDHVSSLYPEGNKAE